MTKFDIQAASRAGGNLSVSTHGSHSPSIYDLQRYKAEVKKNPEN